MIRVAIVGGAGRMGQTMLRGLGDESDLDIIALVDPFEPARREGVEWRRSLAEFEPSQIDVVVDFSIVEVSRATIEWCLVNSVAGVIGTSGLRPEETAQIATRAASAGGHVVVASNFSVGAVLAERFAAQAAQYFERVEIIELHHDQKVDSPSGTSIATARTIADARRAAGMAPLVDPTERETIVHARGAEGADGVRIHAVRLPGLVAHQEIIFGRAGEGLTIRHDSYDRESFVAGVALAVRAVRGRPGLTLGIHELV